MKTCEDCIHCSICVERDELFYEAENCFNFKDSSKFIELPCSIGDTVWAIMYNAVLESKVIRVRPIIKPDNEYCIGLVATINDKLCWDGRLFGHEIFCMLDEDTFLTKEEAEKKLEDMT